MAIKTTVEIPDELFVAAKRQAASQRRIKWVTVDGGLPVNLDVADRAAMIERLACR